MCPSASAVMPPTCPMIQLFGSSFGQVASTAKVGTSPASALRIDSGTPISTAAVTQAAMVLVKCWTAGIERARWFIGIGSSPDFIDGFFPAWRAVNRGEGRKSTACHAVIASEAKQSILVLRRNGLLRFARNDEEGVTQARDPMAGTAYDSTFSRHAMPEV